MRTVIETAYGQGIGEIFLIALPLAVLTVVMVALLPNIPLGRKTGVQQLAEKEAETLVAVGLDEIGATPRS